MKIPALYLSRYGSLNPERCSMDTIRDVLDGNESGELVRVSMGDDGDLVTTSLTEADLAKLRADFQLIQIAALRETLDAALATFHRKSNARGVFFNPSSVTIWIEEAPHAEAVVREWAAANGLGVEDEPLPTDPKVKTWQRSGFVHLPGSRYDRVVSMRWPTVKIDEAHLPAVDAISAAFNSVGSPVEMEPF